MGARRRRFDLKSNKLRPERWTSSDAAGCRSFPLSCATTSANGDGRTRASLHCQADSARLRLSGAPFREQADRRELAANGRASAARGDFDITGFPPHAQAILKGLKKHGMVVADNGGDWRLSIAPDRRLKGLESLTRLKGGDFEVVDTESGRKTQ